jgi:hypothetical protein
MRETKPFPQYESLQFVYSDTLFGMSLIQYKFDVFKLINIHEVKARFDD